MVSTMYNVVQCGKSSNIRSDWSIPGAQRKIKEWCLGTAQRHHKQVWNWCLIMTLTPVKSLKDITIFPIYWYVSIIFQNITKFSSQTIHHRYRRHYWFVLRLHLPCFVTQFNLLWHMCVGSLESLVLVCWSRHRDRWDRIPAFKEYILFQNTSPIHLFSISTDPKTSSLSCNTHRIPPSAPSSQAQVSCHSHSH